VYQTHQQRRRDAVTGHVANDERYAATGKTHHVVEERGDATLAS
jgi:hypothetical protein